MEAIVKLLNETLNIDFINAVLSNPRTKEGIIKVKVRPVKLREKRMFQCEAFSKTQVFHENLEQAEAVDRMISYMKEFRQMQLKTSDAEYTVLISKKGKATIKKRMVKSAVKPADLSHNRKKRYILEEGMKVPFLEDLGVMTAEGKIVRTKFDKYRQINRFLEFVEDILPELEKNGEITILDFGCGKSYLTFAVYYYLHEMKHLDIRIIGLDLKEEVITHCNQLAEKYKYDKLTFLTGDIADYEGVDSVDMVVTLHACDTATDYALNKAICWGAKVILSVPCCQHEVNRQIRNEILSPVTEYGLLKERLAALVTDGLRAKYLESAGYETQVLEFIDMEHTPKNILLRAVKKNGLSDRRVETLEQIRMCEEFLQIHPTLGRLLYGEDKGAEI